jgi:glycosyltransferase involved in cell wall biosynthesis
LDRSRVAVVIPAFNEAGAIARVVEGARAFGTVVVVDDASTDATAAVAAESGADVVRQGENGGYDRALDAGARRAKALGCSIFLTMDADGQHDPDLIPLFLERMRDGADVVIGVRDRFQRFGEWTFALFGRWLWGIRDPMCGMKCYRMSVYNELGHFDSYGSIGTELAIYAARSGRPLANTPIKTRPRSGASRFGAGWRANKRILRALVLGVTRTHSDAVSVSR